MKLVIIIAQALEVYYSVSRCDSSVFQATTKSEAEKIQALIDQHLPEKSNWVDAMIKNSINPCLGERLMDLFDYYQDFCYAYLKFNNKEDLAK